MADGSVTWRVAWLVVAKGKHWGVLSVVLRVAKTANVWVAKME